jgi:hypothetical protein
MAFINSFFTLKRLYAASKTEVSVALLIAEIASLKSWFSVRLGLVPQVGFVGALVSLTTGPVAVCLLI